MSFIDYLYVFVLVLYGANATLFTRGYGNVLYFATYIPLLFATIIGAKHRITLNENFGKSIAVFMVYYLLASIFNRYFSGGFISYWLITLIISYITCKSFGKKYFVLFEHVVVLLSIISLVLWGAYLVAPDAVMGFCKQIRFSGWYEDSKIDVVNIIIFSLLDNVGSITDSYFLFYRNSGFSFEPGAYACIVCFAIACNIIRNNGIKVSGNFPLLILLLSLFSTESTTGGFTLILIFILWFLSNYKSKKSILYIILVPLSIWIINLEFVGDKFLDEFESSQGISYSTGAFSGGTGRVMSFWLFLEEFKARPLFGLAGDPHTLLMARNSDASLHSGIGFLLSQFGAIMSLVFLYLCILSRKIIDYVTGNKSLVLFGALIGSMLSFSMWTYPAFFIFVIFGFFSPYYRDYSTKTNKTNRIKQ